MRRFRRKDDYSGDVIHIVQALISAKRMSPVFQKARGSAVIHSWNPSSALPSMPFNSPSRNSNLANCPRYLSCTMQLSLLLRKYYLLPDVRETSWWSSYAPHNFWGTAVEFPYSTGQGPEVTKHSLLDERWDTIGINPCVVAISEGWASEHNMAPTQR